MLIQFNTSLSKNSVEHSVTVVCVMVEFKKKCLSVLAGSLCI